MPKTMKAVVIHEYGTNDVVRIEDVLRPEPGAGELLVKVMAAGLNPIDFKIRVGAGQRLGMTLPIRLGKELVGSVEGVGAGVAGFAPGDVVFGMVHSGAFAEYAAVKASDMVHTPSGLGPIVAATLPLAGTTAWQAVFDIAELQADQRLLITGGSGGVGSLAVQFAKARGAHVTALASGRNEEFVRSLGVDDFIDYTAAPFERFVHDMDVVLDTVGGDTFERAFTALRKGGYMVTVVAFPKDEAERHGVRVERSFTSPNAASLAAIVELFQARKVKPHVEAVFPFARIRDALARSEEGRTRGKIVLSLAA